MKEATEILDSVWPLLAMMAEGRRRTQGAEPVTFIRTFGTRRLGDQRNVF